MHIGPFESWLVWLTSPWLAKMTRRVLRVDALRTQSGVHVLCVRTVVHPHTRSLPTRRSLLCRDDFIPSGSRVVFLTFLQVVGSDKLHVGNRTVPRKSTLRFSLAKAAEMDSHD